MTATQILIFTMACACLTNSARANVRCEDLFEVSVSAEAAIRTPLENLRSAMAEIELEQDAARDREWTNAQLAEIRSKGRLEFDSAERAIKYYRGLIVWKLRELSNAIEEITQDELIARYKSTWPAKIKVEQIEISLFTNQADFLHAFELTTTVMKVPNPNADQVANVLSIMNRVRSMRRTPWVDPTKFETSAMDLLGRVFPSVTIEQIRELAKNPTPKFRELACCGTGNCAGCTHPNVVFRDVDRWHGPTHLEAAIAATLPLYRTMDRLKEDFPDEPFGTNFWDARVEFETTRKRE